MRCVLHARASYTYAVKYGILFSYRGTGNDISWTKDNKQAITQNHKIVEMEFIFVYFDETIYFFKSLQV